MKFLLIQIFFSFFFLFYGCAPTKERQLVYSESSIKYSSYFYTDVEKTSDLQIRKLYSLFSRCGYFEVQALSYMYDVILGATFPPPSSLMAQKIKTVVEEQFPQLSQRYVREVSQHMNFVYQLTLEFFLNKTREAIYEDWQYIENSLDHRFEGEVPEYIRDYVRDVQERLKRVLVLIQPFQSPCEESDQQKLPIKGRVTFLIGMNVFEMAEHVSSRKLMTQREFLNGVQNEKLIELLLNQNIESLEGYLFPGSYTLTRGDGSLDLIAQMVRRFIGVYDSAQKDIGLTRHQAVILASMIEKEAVVNQEKPIIASVFFNRLKKGMRLQSDPTVTYGVLKQTGLKPVRLTRRHLRTQTPYNTYKVSQLPYGPISNPGFESISAVFNPRKTPYFFFVSRDGRTHSFSVTYEEHKKHVRAYRNRIGK